MSRRPEITDLATIREPSAPVILPDDSAVVSVLSGFDDRGVAVSELWWHPLGSDADSPPVRLTTDHRDSGSDVTPDGGSVVFVRGSDSGADLHRVPVAGGDPERLTDGLRVTGDVACSPDGARIAFTALVDDAGGTEEEPAPPLVVDGPPQHVMDGLGWIGTARLQVFVLDTTGEAEPVRIRVPDHCGAPAWSPDGRTLAFVRTSYGEPGAQIRRRVVLTDTGALGAGEPELRTPFTAQAVGGPLTWYPDGSAVIAIGTEQLEVGPDRLLALDPETGASTDLTEGLDRGVMGGAPGYPGGAPAFAADGRLWFCLRDEGRSVVYSRGSEGDRQPLDLGEGAVVSGLSVGAHRAVAAVATPSAPVELLTVDLADGRQTPLTRGLAEALPEVEFLATQPRWFTIADGTRVHGWLLRDPSTTGPAPTLLDIHGGPHNAWTGVADTAHLYHQVLAAAGWNVLTLNPRASDGYGTQFLRAALGAWGEGDQQDFVEPLEQLVGEGLADPERLVVAGYSYGGFMAAWLSARTDLFRAAVTGGLVCDHHGMTASSDLGGFLRALEIGEEEGAADRLAPITYVDQVSAPTLILHGQDDQRCPLAQAELWYSRLRANGVTTRLVIYPGGGHVFFLSGPLRHRQDFNTRIVDWAQEHTR